MNTLSNFSRNGFAIMNGVYTTSQIKTLLNCIGQANSNEENFRKSDQLFAIRQFLKEVPTVVDTLFNKEVRSLLAELLGEKYFVVKSIYFDKPPTSNWFVPYHQDLTISVDKKLELYGYSFWTTKHQQFAVQPPMELLQKIVTLRIHLDETNEENGALYVVPSSHAKGVYRPETIDWTVESEVCCPVACGGIMLMKPLLLHRSGKTINHKPRRVIHLELCNQELPNPLQWSERLNLN